MGALPSLQPWHTERLREEFNARRHGEIDFAGYLLRKAKLFDELREKVATWDASDEALVYSRFNPAGRLSLLVEGAPYNRSFRLTPAQPVGSALLIHGLSDSPYSMKALAESLYARGFEVTVLRVPGHGTLPSMMTEMTARDWKAAVRIAARDVAARASAAWRRRREFDGVIDGIVYAGMAGAGFAFSAVSYTHLTLPTNREV